MVRIQEDNPGPKWLPFVMRDGDSPGEALWMSTRAGQPAEQRLARMLQMQAVITRVAREIGPALQLQPVLETILHAMRSLFEFKGGTICLTDNGNVYIAASDPPVSAEVAALRLPVGTGLAGRVIAVGKTIYSPDLDADERVDPEIRRLGSNAAMKSYLAVPLVCLGQVIGLLQVDSARENAFDPDDIVMMEGLAAQAAGAIESARRYEKVIELEQMKNDFLARVSHEFRTPLTIVSGFADTIAQQWTHLDADAIVSMLDRMQAATGRLRDLIEELLQVTSLEAGVNVTQRTLVRLHTVLESVAHDSLSDRVTISCDPSLIVETDERVLRHALGLLVENAMVYAGDAHISVTSGDQLIIEVRDHGQGIDADMRELIFDRFVRGRDDTPGMGLGLSLARTLAAAVGAHVEAVDPPEGDGACFRLTFGAARAVKVNPASTA